MPHRVFSAVPLPQGVLDVLSQACDVTCHGGPGRITAEEFVSSAAAFEGVLCPSDLRVPAELLKSPNLRVVSNIGVGYDNVDLRVAAERGIAVTNTPGVLSAAVADLTLGLIITLARGLREAERFVGKGRWGAPGARLPLGVDLKGKTLGIVGFGRIGREVAVRAAAFGMDIVVHDARADLPHGPIARRAASLDELLRDTDFVTLHVDLNPTTRHLIGARELGLMKPTAYLINTSRGAVVDQQALYGALKDGRIAGAGLDVLEQEPPDRADPILQLPNVCVFPHIGSATRETRRAMLELAIANLLACLEGRPCNCIVTPR